MPEIPGEGEILGFLSLPISGSPLFFFFLLTYCINGNESGFCSV